MARCTGGEDDGILVDLPLVGGLPALWLTSCVDIMIEVGSTILGAGEGWRVIFGEGYY